MIKSAVMRLNKDAHDTENTTLYVVISTALQFRVKSKVLLDQLKEYENTQKRKINQIQ